MLRVSNSTLSMRRHTYVKLSTVNGFQVDFLAILQMSVFPRNANLIDFFLVHTFVWFSYYFWIFGHESKMSERVEWTWTLPQYSLHAERVHGNCFAKSGHRRRVHLVEIWHTAFFWFHTIYLGLFVTVFLSLYDKFATSFYVINH